MNSLLKIIKKNIKLLIRARSSSLIIILGPIMMIFLAGIAFDTTNRFNINIGTYSQSYSELSTSFIETLRKQDFSVQKIHSEQACINLIKQGKLHTCIVFPPNMTISDKRPTIEFHIDYSKINLVWTILEVLSERFEQRSTELGKELASLLLKKLENARIVLYNSRPMITELKLKANETAEKGQSIIQEISAAKLDELLDKSLNSTNYILSKINTTMESIDEIKDDINESNATDSQKEAIIQDLGSVRTHLYNIFSRIEDPNNLTDADFKDINSMLESAKNALQRADIAANAIKIASQSSREKLDALQQDIDALHNDLGNIRITNATAIASPVQTKINPVIPERSYLNYTLPALLVLVVMFISILLATTLVMMERHSPAFFRNFMTPVRSSIFVAATYATNIILVLVQLAVVLSTAVIFVKADIIPALAPSIGGLLLSASVFTFIGMLIGYIFSSEETATLASISAGSIFLFLSNVIIPIERMPLYIAKVAHFSPFVLAESLLRKVLIFNLGLADCILEICLLGAYSAALFFVLLTIHRSLIRPVFKPLKFFRRRA